MDQSSFILENLKRQLLDPTAIFVNMSRGVIAKPSFRDMLSLYGEVLNTEDAQLVEIARLRAEVERLNEMMSSTCGVGDGSGSLFVHGRYDAVKKVQGMVFSLERLRPVHAMILNALDRDAEGGKPARGEMAKELRNAINLIDG